jgi:hypothetical protein
MSKKEFETSAIIVFALSLLYVPTNVCGEDYCVSGGWGLITSLEGSVIQLDFTLLAIQELVIGLALFAIWNFKFRK